MHFGRYLVAPALFVALASTHALAGSGTITIDASRKGPAISPQMYGIFLEEINHGVDGGLYAEMVRNRAFEGNNPPEGGRGNFQPDPTGLPGWTLVRERDTAAAAMSAVTDGPLNANTPHSLLLEVAEPAGGRVGIRNDGFWGMNVRQGEKYALSFYARGGIRGPLTVTLEGADGKPCSKPVTVSGLASGWKRFRATLSGTRDETEASLVLATGSKGNAWFDMVSLMPAKAWKGLPLRPDIAQMIADLKPAFVRFPGGCVVEGYAPENAYNWKWTIGPVEQRREAFNAWDDRRTHGFGFHEYLRFIEAMDAQPLFVMFAGETCYYRGIQHVPFNELDWVVDSYLQAMEYANGPADSPWGKERAKAGHPEPFAPMMIGIGNENWFPEYVRNYKIIYKALKDRHPDTLTFACINEKGMPVDMVDNHHYASPRWLLHSRNYARWDRSDPKVYIGELATYSPETDGGYNILAGLAEAAYMLHLEENADVVRMVSYAPLLANVDGRTGWHGCINFDSSRVFGTPAYHVQKVFSHNRPTYTVATETSFAPDVPETLVGRVGVEAMRVDAQFKDLRVEKAGQALYTSDFAGGTDGWETDGSVQARDGALAITGVGKAFTGRPDWAGHDVSVRVKVDKVHDANEGAVVLHFASTDKMDNGWRIQKGGTESFVYGCDNGHGNRPVRIEPGQWHDLRVEVRGLHVRCLIDGQVVHEADMERVQLLRASAGIDEATGETVVKVVNTHPEPISAVLDLRGVEKVAPVARVTTMKGDSLNARNTLDEPDRVVPVNSTFQGAGKAFAYEFPPCSLTVLRLKTGR